MMWKKWDLVWYQEQYVSHKTISIDSREACKNARYGSRTSTREDDRGQASHHRFGCCISIRFQWKACSDNWQCPSIDFFTKLNTNMKPKPPRFFLFQFPNWFQFSPSCLMSKLNKKRHRIKNPELIIMKIIFQFDYSNRLHVQ